MAKMLTGSSSAELTRQAGTTPLPSSPATAVPLLVFCPCYLPSSDSTVTVREVLDRLIVRMEPFVDGPFCAILFSSPMPDGLSTQLLLSLYFKLSRPARKNLQRLWSVHRFASRTDAAGSSIHPSSCAWRRASSSRAS